MTAPSPQPEQRASALQPGSTFHGYTVVRCVGIGGMGAVFEGLHELLGRRCAIKILHAKIAEKPEARERFVREARSVARIRHPNVVDVFDVGLLGETPYLVMEFLEGESLETALGRLQAMSAQQATTVLLPVAAAIAAVHRAGLIHRDVKPDNVFLARDAKGHVIPKLVDFGIAKDLAAPMLGAHHTVVGTPHYMSPEQARGSLTMDARTDQYAFGVMLYQLATGRLPFDAESLLDLMRAIDEGRAVPPRQVNPELSPAFEQLVLRAMARDANDRFASMQELGRSLLPFASPRLRAMYSTDFGVSGPSTDELDAYQGNEDDGSIDRITSSELTATSTTTTLDRMVRRPSEMPGVTASTQPTPSGVHPVNRHGRATPATQPDPAMASAAPAPSEAETPASPSRSGGLILLAGLLLLMVVGLGYLLGRSAPSETPVATEAVSPSLPSVSAPGAPTPAPPATSAPSPAPVPAPSEPVAATAAADAPAADDSLVPDSSPMRSVPRRATPRPGGAPSSAPSPSEPAAIRLTR